MNDKAFLAGSFDLGSRCLNHSSIGNARRTSGFTAAARQTAIQVFNVRVSNGRAIHHRVHLVNTTAGRIEFYAKLTIGRARIQAQAAMYALIEVRLARPAFGISLDFE